MVLPLVLVQQIQNYSKFEADCSPVGNLETAGAGSSHFGSFGRLAFSSARRNREWDSEFTEPASDHGHPPTVHTPQQDSQVIDTLGPQISRNSSSSGFSVRKFCATNPFTPSFDALECPTSPLPPSSPLPSSTLHGYLCPVPHVNEVAPPDFDTTPARGSCRAGSSSRSSYLRLMTPDSASESLPVRYLSYSRGIREVPAPHFMPSSSKADIILELLARDHPWNAIGDMLDLPPIPTANETYFKEITSHRTVSHELVSPLASSSSTGRVHSVVLTSPVRMKDKRLQTTPSEDALLAPSSTLHGVKSSPASDLSLHWDTISEIDLDALIPKIPSTKATMAETYRPMTAYPEFRDNKADLGRTSYLRDLSRIKI